MTLTFYRLLAWLTRATLGRYLMITTRGAEHIPADAPFILASNHKSTLDPILLVAYTIAKTQLPVAPAATQGLFVGPLGWFLRGLGAVDIDRVNNRNIASVRQLLRALKQRPILIFPEGGIHAEEGLREAKEGVGFLAQHAAVPVIPVAVVGTDQSLPSGGRWIRRTRVTLIFGKPCTYETSRDYQGTADAIMKEINQLCLSSD